MKSINQKLVNILSQNFAHMFRSLLVDINIDIVDVVVEESRKRVPPELNIN